jgi:chemotaxis protein CheX
MNQPAMVNALRCATAEVFSTMLGIDILPGEPHTEINAPGPSDGIIAAIGLAGNWVGTASICCDPSTGCWMASRMLGTEFTEINEEVLDAISEITNMIIGGFKTQAEAYYGLLGLSIPMVVYGLRFSARTAGKEQWVVVPFASGGHTLDIKVCLTPNRGLPRLTTMGIAHPAHQ